MKLKFIFLILGLLFFSPRQEAGEESGLIEEKRTFNTYGAFHRNESPDIPLKKVHVTFEDKDHGISSSSDILVALENYMDKCLVHPKEPPTLVKAAGITGLGSGILGSFVYAFVSGDFGVMVAKAVGVEDHSILKGIDVFFALNTMLPEMGLNGLPSRSNFQKVATFLYSSKSDPLEDPDTRLKAINVAAPILSVFSWASLGYIAYSVANEVALPIRVVLTVFPCVCSCQFATEAEKKLARWVLRSWREPEDIRLKRRAICEKFIQSMKAISNLTDSEVGVLYKEIFAPLERQKEGEGPFSSPSKIEKLLNLGKSMPDLTPWSKHREMGSRAAKIIGGIIGGMEIYVTSTLAWYSTAPVCDAIGIHDPVTQRYIAETLRVLACIPWSSLYITGTVEQSTRIFDWFFNKDRACQREFAYPKLGQWLSGYSFLGGVFTALPTTYFAYQVTDWLPVWMRLLYSSTILCSTTAVMTSSLKAILDQGLTLIKSQQDGSPELQREALMNLIEALCSKIGELPDSMVDLLSEKI